ncbi:MAG: hypothetical protein NT018_11880, partial [Armatimonadetes bacterium]|nr:hypothetical protein [Armatimonadota bacterium]
RNYAIQNTTKNIITSCFLLIYLYNLFLHGDIFPLQLTGVKFALHRHQISASTATINKVSALWQYEDLFGGGQFRVKILVPTTSTNPLKMKRVDGAGITALVDMALSQQKDIPQEKSRRDTIIDKLGGILKKSGSRK